MERGTLQTTAVRGVLGVSRSVAYLVGRRRSDSPGQNRTGEIPLSGIAGGLGETYPMVGIGSQPVSESAVLVTPDLQDGAPQFYPDGAADKIVDLVGCKSPHRQLLDSDG